VPEAAEAARIAVVGGGLAGLAAARALRAAGFEVVVFEAGAAPGGVVATSRADGFLREHGASSFLATPGGVAELAEQLGVALVPSPASAKRRWIFVDGALRAVPTSPRELIETDLLSLRGKLRLLAEPFARGRPEGDDETVADLIERRLGPEALRRLGAPFVTGVFAGDAAALSARSAFPTLAALDADGGFALGMVRRALRARRAGADAGGARRRGVVAPVAGMQALIDALAGSLGGALRTGREVAAVATVGDGPRRVSITLRSGEVERFDVAVLALPAPRAVPLVAAASPALAAVLGELASAPAAVVHLGVRRAELGHPLGGFGFLAAAGEPLRLLGCVFESELWPDRAPPGAALLRCILGGTRDPAALDLGDGELVDACVRDLDRALGGFPTPIHANVVRWRDAIPQYATGHRSRLVRAEAQAAPLGVVLAGASYHGVGVNPAAADAPRVVAAVRARLGLAAVAAAAVACAGGQSGARLDGGSAPTTARATEPDKPLVSETRTPTPEGGPGALEVVIEWRRPPAELLRSPGVTACGGPRAAPLRPAGLAGVAGAAVVLDGAAAATPTAPAPTAPAPAALSIVDCQLAPAVIVVSAGGVVELDNRDARRHEVALVALAPRATVAAAPLATVGLALFGQRRQLAIAAPGLYRLELVGGDPAWLVARAGGRVATSADGGVVRFADVAPGRHAIEVVHPPVVPGGAPLVVEATTEIVAGQSTRVVVELDEVGKPERAP
jgi:oxygen-dependent protoporphyrinogen oxidase